MSLPPGSDKSSVRAWVQSRRAELDPAWSEAASRDIVRVLQALPEVIEAPEVAAYLALPGEPDLDALAYWVGERGRALLVPAFDPEGRRYRMCPCDMNAVAVGRFGVREPVRREWADDVRPGVWLVPGLAFDRDGHRVGHGAGHYDRLLRESSGARIGVCFAFQLLDAVATDVHDVDMDLVVTEHGVHRR